MSKRSEPQLPSGFDLGQLRKQAKELKRAARAGDARVIACIAAVHPKYEGRAAERVVPDHMTLRDAQATLAREAGFAGWRELVEAAEEAGGRTAQRWRKDADRSFFGRTLREAEALNHGAVDPDEILLALLQPPQPTVVAAVLEEVGLTLDAVRDWMVSQSPPGVEAGPGGLRNQPRLGRLPGDGEGAGTGRWQR